ncbi:hypothetical protein [Caloranaerobacter azorensis]|uniref:Uncharacterized protein n=1 Tax=Caloranaerobacter azorensis TaxID=116090 RepID=A0A6P1YDX8_9FIRM|nr:hypothetical protein [Caloranaerobacter azorensis]QIB27569.1 hypothetical protein G3A45_09895 [Caloranaerobacter azorensis]
MIFKDKVINKIINADLNGACILGNRKVQQKYKAGGKTHWLNFKLCNPIKVESDVKFANRSIG